MAYGRPSSSTFVVKTFLNISEYDERYLNKSVNVANSAYNEMLSVGIKRLNALHKDEQYRILINKLKECDDEDKHKKKLIYDQLNVLCINYNLTTKAFLDYLRLKRNNGILYKRLNSNELQLIAIHAFETIENVLYGKSKLKNLKFKSKYKESSFRNNINNTGTRLIKNNIPKYAYDLLVHGKHKISIKRNNFTVYQQHCLLKADKIKYVQIKQIKIRGKIRYQLIIYLEGNPIEKYKLGKGTIGCDNGISTFAYVSDNEIKLIDLVPKDILRLEENIRRLNRRLDRKNRKNNPHCFDEKGKFITGSRIKVRSKNYLKLIIRRQKVYRKMYILREELQNNLCNTLLKQADVIKVEKLDVEKLKIRYKDIRINPKTNRPYSNKRYGRSMLRGAPSMLITRLQLKCAMKQAKFVEINPKDTKPSQYNHILNENINRSLDVRIYNLSSEYPNIQRDMYSAILNKFTIVKNKKFTIDTKKLTNEFETYYNLMQLEIEKIKNNNTSRLSWYVN